MSQGTIENFSALAAAIPNEIITHSLVTDVSLPGGKRLALLTLDNGLDHSKPTTLGPNTLIELHGVLTQHGLQLVGAATRGQKALSPARCQHQYAWWLNGQLNTG